MSAAQPFPLLLLAWLYSGLTRCSFHFWIVKDSSAEAGLVVLAANFFINPMAAVLFYLVLVTLRFDSHLLAFLCILCEIETDFCFICVASLIPLLF